MRNSNKKLRTWVKGQESKTIGIASRIWAKIWVIISRTWAKVRTLTVVNGSNKIQRTSEKPFSLQKISSMNSKTSKTKMMETRKES